MMEDDMIIYKDKNVQLREMMCEMKWGDLKCSRSLTTDALIVIKHVYHTLVSRHLSVLHDPQLVQYKIVELAHTFLDGTAACYSGPLVGLSDLQGRRTLRSASTARLVVSPFQLWLRLWLTVCLRNFQTLKLWDLLLNFDESNFDFETTKLWISDSPTPTIALCNWIFDFGNLKLQLRLYLWLLMSGSRTVK